MSSRALRKAQKEREEQDRLAGQEIEDADGPDESRGARRPQKSLFSMLDEAESEHNQSDDDEEEQELKEGGVPQTQEASGAENQGPTSTAKRKKKKKKATKKKKALVEEGTQAAQMDEIDAALQALSTKSNAAKPDTATVSTVDPEVEELCRLLSVDTSHLHAANEMRRLFGRTAVEDEGEGRRNRGQQQGGLAAAIGSRGSSLAELARKRNIFIQGRENWPSAPSGGLGMEVVEKRSDGSVEYAFVHNGSYRDSQRQFEACVASMDPERMVQHLHFNPYHISTLLQVSEIAKHQGDHAIAGELLERALFSFGRAVHSTFSNNLSHGKARLSFLRAENREFWLAVWRFIGNLSMRSLFRTSYEWLMLLLGLDPFNDPYRICLIMDQYAIRSKQVEHFLELYKAMDKPWLWGKLPNIQLSRGLAINHAKTLNDGKQQLYKSAARWPWITARLFQELEIDQIPPSIWGSMPRTEREILEMEMYVKRAKNIWNTPEAKELLIEVVSAIPTGLKANEPDDSPITVDEARHILLTEDPELIKHIPKETTSKVSSASDPLPPEEDALLQDQD
ncbi:DUF654-domain-containing protein [Viridothelium virens]|uniref:DUF654-domain-containing protein n=1 Tax=Viridothelium virens TaxID=1048519 RepID=A0A6A6HAL1_VIRVR|nr:DUF654-domain-containing protein [Viridothelium virens]